MPPTTCQHLVQGGNEYYHHLYANEQKRKLSYDEDVYDYELSDDNDDAENGNVDEDENDKSKEEQFDAKVAYLQLKRYAAKQRKSKEDTPESDYASENNYPQSEAEAETDKEENEDDDDDDDDSDNICNIYQQFNLSVYETPLGYSSKHESVVEESDDIQDNDDFLTTTFTWNLCNKNKLKLNDRENDDDSSDDMDLPKLDEDDNSVELQKSFNNEDDVNLRQVKEESPEKQHKLDKLERCWPWADREKIIYKQSTCHLVPHKPLGLIGQRIQLLAKRNLLEHLNNNKNPQ